MVDITRRYKTPCAECPASEECWNYGYVKIPMKESIGLNVIATFQSHSLIPKPAEFQSMTDWQPIDTAPTDGTEVLITDGEDYSVACWIKGYGWRDMGDMGWAGKVGVDPTHWMPLPAPPESGGSEP